MPLLAFDHSILTCTKTVQKWNELQKNFMKLQGCRIDSPGGDDAEIFRGRKNFFAINVQAVSDSKLKFKDIIARWPA
jgi:hypothetical protein